MTKKINNMKKIIFLFVFSLVNIAKAQSISGLTEFTVNSNVYKIENNNSYYLSISNSNNVLRNQKIMYPKSDCYKISLKQIEQEKIFNIFRNIFSSSRKQDFQNERFMMILLYVSETGLVKEVLFRVPFNSTITTQEIYSLESSIKNLQLILPDENYCLGISYRIYGRYIKIPEL